MEIETIAAPLLRTIESVGSWQSPVLSRTVLTPPGSPTAGDRYLLDGTPTGAWSGYGGSIVECVGPTLVQPYTFILPHKGMVAYVGDTSEIWIYDGSAWRRALTV
jgi:hypothetical protein